MPYIKAALFRLWMVSCLAMPTLAQDADVSGSRQSDARKAWFVQTGIPEGLENPVKVMTGRDVKLLTLSNRLASGPVKIPADGVIRLVKVVPDPADPAKSTYLTLAEAKVPEQMNQALVILVPSPVDHKTDRLFHAKVQGLTDFKGGDCLYINLTNLNFGVEIGERKMPLKPGMTSIYNGKADAEAGNVPFRYSYFHPTQEKWKVLSASITIMSPTRREIVVFSVDGKSNRVKCSNITFPVPQARTSPQQSSP